MTFPVIADVEDTEYDTATASPHSVALPECEAGDLLLLIGSIDGAFIGATPPEDWESLASGSNESGLVAAYRVADGNEGASISVAVDDTQEAKWTVLRITGADVETPPVVSTVATGTDENVDPGSLAHTWEAEEDTLWLAVGAWDNGAQNRFLQTGPANYTLVSGLESVVSLAVYSRELAAASEDPAAIVLNGGEGWLAATIAIRPAAEGATAPTISSISDATLTHEQTSIVITGTGFSESGNTVLISPTDDVEDEDAVSQTITAEGTTSITFTADLDSFEFDDTLYLFVVNGDSESNENGEAVSRVAGSVKLTGYRLLSKTSQPLTGLTGITALIYQSVPSSLTAPAKRVADLATDEETGVLDDIDLSDIQSNDDPVWLTLMLDGEPPRAVTIKLTPAAT